MNPETDPFYYWLVKILPDETRESELYFNRKDAIKAMFTAANQINCPLHMVFNFDNLPNEPFESGLISAVNWDFIKLELRATRV